MNYYHAEDYSQTKIIQFYGYFDPYGMTVMSNNEINVIEYETKQKLRNQSSNSPTQSSTTNSNKASNGINGSYTKDNNQKNSLINYFVDALNGEDTNDNKKQSIPLIKVLNEECKTHKTLAAQLLSILSDKYDPLLFWKQHKHFVTKSSNISSKIFGFSRHKY
ncbi:unnamed protein product [Adineta steineri]|uniref:Uncharacterized protein n=1 Tax=Adineta steineri TaxID=433720 RepID=A0A815T9T2_9BILA|nr:unnamed protein product [Adineta steineri]CAF4080717.1 unnamed protein product [Adineta steineri]